MQMFKSGAIALAFVTAVVTNPASAAEYPSKAINALCGFSAGSGMDIFSRNLGASISKYLNDQPFVVVNKAGGAQIPAM